MTKLLYTEDFDVLHCEATVVEVGEHEDKVVITLNETCFYPKGGGQDFDQGTITAPDAEFTVEAVFYNDGEVKHIGEYAKGQLSVGDSVSCQVNAVRRNLNTRIHSAGHVIDMAIRSLGWDWKPEKGAHYPHMSFVEYAGDLDSNNKEQLVQELQEKIDELIATGTTNSIQFMTPEEMSAAGAVVPDNLPKSKPTRAVLYDHFIVPCGGTHVKDIKEIGEVGISKIKPKDGSIRVSYAIEPLEG